MKQLEMFCTLEEAEAIAEEKRSQVRDQVVRLLQVEQSEGREASEAGDLSVSLSSKTQ